MKFHFTNAYELRILFKKWKKFHFTNDYELHIYYIKHGGEDEESH
jgi:hypothetical protein